MINHNKFVEKFQVPQAAVPFLSAWFSAEEISLVEDSPDDLFTAEDVAGIFPGQNPADALVAAYRRGVISIADKEAGTYRISSYYGWMDVFVLSRKAEYDLLSREVKTALDDWYFDAFLQYVSADVSGQPTPDEILPMEAVLDWIDEQAGRPVFLNYCDCRSLSGDCGAPTRTCITYKNGINTMADRGIAEPIDRERAKEVVRMAEKAGLMHTVNPNGICNCCGDCCYLFRAQERLQRRGIWPATKTRIVLEVERCVGCRRCVKRCHFNVFSPDGRKVAADVDLCVGCGICVSTCPVQALTLEVR